MMGMHKLNPMPFIVCPPQVTSSTRYGNISIKVTILHFFYEGASPCQTFSNSF